MIRIRRFLAKLHSSAAVSLIALIFASTSLPALAQPVPGAPSQEEISAFSSTINVNEDGTVGVVENIDYFFPEPKHGIYRDIPSQYKNDKGKTYRIPITVVRVSDATGKAWKYALEKNNVGIRIKIGDPDKTVKGWQSYVISYYAVGALRYDQQYPEGDTMQATLHDELYWNVTGNAWQVPIRRVSAVVKLPGSVASESIRTKCYTGPAGSTASDCLAGVHGTQASFASNDALTVVVGWPTGMVAHLEPLLPPWWEKALPFVPLLLPIVVFVLMFRTWKRHGRDPKGRGTLVVQYDAPKGMRPAEAGVILDEDAGMNDVSAIIIDLAVRGYLKIREVEKKGIFLKSVDYEFDRLKEYRGDATLKPFELRTLDALFAGATTTSVSAIKEKKEFYQDLPDIKSRLYEGLVLDGYYLKNPSKVRSQWMGGGGIIMFASFFIAGPLADFGNPALTKIAVASCALSGLIVLVFGYFMPSRTQKGVEAFEHVKGFREYLAKAEKYRIQWQEKENVFEKFLPFAMAFGVADKWSKAFEGMKMQPPSWYEGRAFSSGSFNPGLFYGALSSMNNNMVAAMKTQPQQSGSGSGFGGGGGGGFSGGGGGGGGGGSW